jgi:hypothetical protein
MVHVLPNEEEKIATMRQHRVGSANKWSKETSVTCFISSVVLSKTLFQQILHEETYKTGT